ncbi:MAG: hypothetical protein ACLF0G_08555 [Candidatus Brocadiia bacterium]
MPPQHEAYLAPGEVRGLLAHLRLPLIPESPLWGLPEEPPAGEAALAERSLLDEPWVQAMRALACPDRLLRLLVAYPSQLGAMAFYGCGDGDGLIGCWAEEGRLRISFPREADRLVSQVCRLLAADFPAQHDPFQAEFSPAGLACLAAAVDALRGHVLRGMLERSATAETLLSLQAMEEVYAEGRQGADGRWLVTLLNFLAPTAAALPEQLDESALDELLAADLLRREEESLRATETLCRLAAYWLTPLPALAHEALRFEGQTPQMPQFRLALRGTGPLWVMDFWRDEERGPRVSLVSVIGAAYRASLQATMSELTGRRAAGTPPPTASKPSAEPEPRLCAACGARLGAEARFCTQCGTACG